jgi:hypothetical protein
VEIVDFFAQALSQILGKAELAVVTGDDAQIAPGTTKAVFLVGWDVGGTTIDFDLQAPDGTIFTPTAGPSGIVTAVTYQGGGATSFHSFYVVEGADLGGTWSFVGVPASGRKLVVEDLSLRVHWSIHPKVGVTGEPVVVRARITQNGKPFTGEAQVRARVTSPTASVGEVLAKGGKLLKGGAGQPDPNLRQAAATKGLAAMKMKALPPGKVAEKAFSAVGKGEYELVFEGTNLDGVYRFDVEAQSHAKGAEFHRRITLFSVLVSAPTKGASTVQLLPVAAGLFRLEVTPVRKDKRPVGPFLAPVIKLIPAQGKLSGPVTDHLDGRYSQLLSWNGKGTQAIAIDVLGRRFDAGKVPAPAKKPPSKKSAARATRRRKR